MSDELSNPLLELLKKREVIVLTGTGGVGKTTTSAALAIAAARVGRKVVVVTIDPAKRLKTSLGVSTLGDTPTDLTPNLKKIAPETQGELFAVVPDTEKTFRDFVHSLTQNEELRQRIFENPIYGMLAQDHSGANEYMALKRLDQIHKTGEYDLIILDTPPSRNTLAFLNAPQLLARFFDEKYIQWLASPAQRLFGFGVKKVLGVLENLTGQGFVNDLIEFARALFEVRGPFKEDLNRVTQLLKSSRTGFLMVTQPTPGALEEISHLHQVFDEKGLIFDGLILNRSFSAFDRKEKGEALSTGSNESVGSDKAVELMEALVQREQEAEKRIRKILEGRHVFEAKVPEFARDIHSMGDLALLADHLEKSSSILD